MSATMIDREARAERAAGLADRNLNGFDFVLVSLPAGASPPEATLEVHFLNSRRLRTLIASSAPAKAKFTISGGRRVRGGEGSGEVQVVEVAAVVAGSVPIAADGLDRGETLTVTLGGTAATVALAAGDGPAEILAAVNTALSGAGVNATARLLDGRLAIVSPKTFDLEVVSDQADPKDGGGSGFDQRARHPASDVLVLTVRPVGDYSTYTLLTGSSAAGFDPVFNELPFKFRPACFSLNCHPQAKPAPPRPADPVIDYLAKDYDSFRHLMMTWMEAKVPGWTPSSEADLSQMLLSLFSAAADELSDYQDRVMNEAYLATARSRVSLARYARLMDYYIHQGNQATTLLAVLLEDGSTIEPEGDGPPEIEVWAGGTDVLDPESVVFRGSPRYLHHLANALPLYTWSGAYPGLDAGADEADLGVASEDDADELTDWIHRGRIEELLVQEHLNPLTGRETGADPRKRQRLRLLPEEARKGKDPLTGAWFVHVAWRTEDRLQRAYCGSVVLDGATIDGVTLFHGNLLTVGYGRQKEVVFRGSNGSGSSTGERRAEPTQKDPATGRSKWGTICSLPDDDRLLYRETEPGSGRPSQSTLEVTVDGVPWDEVPSLVESADTDRVFTVETDELQRSVLRMGNGILGENLPEAAEVRCVYQVGLGTEGNVGADRVVRFDPNAFPQAVSVWNPFDVVNGRAPETRDDILRSVPEFYRTRQERAITLGDYAERAQEVTGISRAVAAYAWTGSWRTVRVTLDPAGTDRLLPSLRAEVARHLEPLRLIGEDLELRGPNLVPVTIRVVLCVNPGIWEEEVSVLLEQEFSDGYTPDGRLGFFHPDRWTFGQTLFRSQILGRLERVPGIAHVTSVEMRRSDSPIAGTTDHIDVAADEIIQVLNDPDHMERGSISFDVRGGLA